ncbi:MAG: hypothetical protein JXM68_14580, partial [Sedimentisphaerales bacterium]|nr:hypothetical protein [Sedimentisphaerales bacterium]
FELTISLFPIFGLIFLMALTSYASTMLIAISKANRGLKGIFYLLCYISILFFVCYNGMKFQTVAGLTIWSISALLWSHNKFTIKAIQ